MNFFVNTHQGRWAQRGAHLRGVQSGNPELQTWRQETFLQIQVIQLWVPEQLRIYASREITGVSYSAKGGPKRYDIARVCGVPGWIYV